jgi:hypothetical protein
VQQRRPELVLARLAILLYEADELKRAQDPVNGPLRKAQLTGQLGHSEAV